MVDLSDACQFRSLLIVDDCGDDRAAYQHYLAKDSLQSYQILEVDSAEEGLLLLRDRSFDLVLLDFKLPGMSGIEMLEIMGKDYPHVPVIFLSAYGNEELAVRAMKQGVSDYLPKNSLTAKILQMAVRNAIEQARLQTALERARDRQRLLGATALRIRQSLDREDILSAAVGGVKQLLGSDRALVCEFDEENSINVVAESVGPDWRPMLGHQQIHFSLPIGNGIDRWQFYRQSIANAKTAALPSRDRDFLRRYAVEASMSVPIVLSRVDDDAITQHPWGVLIVHQCSGPRQWNPEDFDTLNELSVQLAIAIQQSELLNGTRQALEEQKCLNAFKSKIIDTVSHEYRTPLTGILTAASTLKQHGDRLELSMRERCLQIIEQRARHLACLVDDMLFASQTQHQLESFQPCLLDPEHFFAEILEERKVAASTNHRIVLNVRDDSAGFWGDRNILRQLFGNLVSNAIKYSPNGGAIDIQVQGAGEWIEVSVTDSGIGIPEQDLETLYQAFSRGSNVGTISGTGLGMATVKACVEMHDGWVSIQSQEGQGTTVAIGLPRQKTTMLETPEDSQTNIELAS
ncbi:MAG: ATP-binding protein [Synechococcus sp.]